MDIIGNCLVPHQFCQRPQVGGKLVGVSVLVDTQSWLGVESLLEGIYIYTVSQNDRSGFS